MTTKKPCPVCGKIFNENTLIFHIRKTAMAEIYEAYCNEVFEETVTLSQDYIRKVAPHQNYIEENSVTIQKFTI